MNESEFIETIDTILMQIEEAIEDNDAGIECETSSGILTLEFENGSQVIINRQTPVRQIWVAAKSGGYHLDLNKEDGSWYTDREGEELFALLVRVCREQSGKTVKLTAGT